MTRYSQLANGMNGACPHIWALEVELTRSGISACNTQPGQDRPDAFECLRRETVTKPSERVRAWQNQKRI